MKKDLEKRSESGNARRRNTTEANAASPAPYQLKDQRASSQVQERQQDLFHRSPKMQGLSQLQSMANQSMDTNNRRVMQAQFEWDKNMEGIGPKAFKEICNEVVYAEIETRPNKAEFRKTEDIIEFQWNDALRIREGKKKGLYPLSVNLHVVVGGGYAGSVYFRGVTGHSCRVADLEEDVQNEVNSYLMHWVKSFGLQDLFLSEKEKAQKRKKDRKNKSKY